MLLNLYSSLPEPLKKVIQFDDFLYVTKLTTSVFGADDYVHIYEKQRNCYRYLKTINLKNLDKMSRQNV